MNFGYGDLLDYLMSPERSNLEVAMEFDMGYIVEKVFNSASPAQKAMMVLDFALNFKGDSTCEIGSVILYYGSDVLASSLCGIPIVLIAKKYATPEAKGAFQRFEASEEEIDEDAVNRIIQMFKTKLPPGPTPLELLGRGLQFINEECFDGEGPKTLF